MSPFETLHSASPLNLARIYPKPKHDSLGGNTDDKRSEKADLAEWKCEMKEEHVNETGKEINSIKRQIFRGCGYPGTMLENGRHARSSIEIHHCSCCHATSSVGQYALLRTFLFTPSRGLPRERISTFPIRNRSGSPHKIQRKGWRTGARVNVVFSRLKFVIVEISENNRPF